MKKDIGIITHLYKSTNYGGVLQAFALCEYLNEQGYKAEQIQYEKTDEPTLRRRIGNICRSLKKYISKGVDLIVCHSEKGHDLLRTVSESVVCQEVSVRAATENIPMNNSPHLPKNRQKFIGSLNTGSFSDSVDKYCSIPFSERVYTKIKLIIKKISRRK